MGADSDFAKGNTSCLHIHKPLLPQQTAPTSKLAIAASAANLLVLRGSAFPTSPKSSLPHMGIFSSTKPQFGEPSKAAVAPGEQKNPRLSLPLSPFPPKAIHACATHGDLNSQPARPEAYQNTLKCSIEHTAKIDTEEGSHVPLHKMPR